MTQSTKKAPMYPKGHLLAASGIAALLSLSLLVFPSAEVEAKKTFMSLELPETGVASTPSADTSLLASPPETAGSPFGPGSDADSAESPLQADQRNDNPLDKATPVALETITTSVTATKGDTLSTVFNRAGISAQILHEALASAPKAQSRELRHIKAGQVFDFDFASTGELREARWQAGALKSIRLAQAGNTYGFSIDEVKPQIRTAYKYGEIDSSLYLSAARAGLPASLVGQMADVFAYDIDFSKVAKGDQFEVIFEEQVVGGKTIGTGKILAARFTNQRQTFTAVRYTNGSFYNEKGMSLRKAFLRTPVDFARISSRFSSGRKHPILNKIRAHQGVDYAAPRGTPIKAAGDGKVILAGRKGGYGNTVIIQHGSSYKTLYGHMQGFAKGVRSGSSVRQGQIIGYIGTTGLSTGPHLHYEFQINGKHVDPLGQKKLMAEPIANKEKGKFLALSKPLLARMNQEKASMLALNKP